MLFVKLRVVQARTFEVKAVEMNVDVLSNEREILISVSRTALSISVRCMASLPSLSVGLGRDHVNQRRHAISPRAQRNGKDGAG